VENNSSLNIENSKLNFAPIVLFVYNRPDHTKQTIEALQKNELATESELFIYSDAAKNEDVADKVQEVREYIKRIDGFKKVTIVEREKNWGLANSIIDGVTKIVNEYGKIIVLEDDLVTSLYFLKFMNEALKTYEDRGDIFSITGFSFSQKFMKIPKEYEKKVYLHYRPMSWSWATWKNRWDLCDWIVAEYEEFKNDKKRIKDFNKGGSDLFNMLKIQKEGKIDSWYIRFCFTAYKFKKYTLYPVKSFISNIGHDGSGIHCSMDFDQKYINNVSSDENSDCQVSSSSYFDRDIKVETKIIKSFNDNFKPKRLRIFLRLIKRFK
jgi:hypothetical protein